jgi:8-oxo-dGTP pyrophosphatase MutT (NUDIX family)
MYKVFVENKPVIFFSAGEPVPIPDGALIHDSPSKTELSGLLTQFSSAKEQHPLFITGKDIEKTFKEFAALYIVVEAGGGLVTNDAGHYLFIYRRGMWDLPKGKAERNESVYDTALREVGEETGLAELRIIRALMPTYHTYEEGGVAILKKNYWYLMHSADTKAPVPQYSEDITHIRWLMKDEVYSIVMNNTFASINSLLEGYFSGQ